MSHPDYVQKLKDASKRIDEEVNPEEHEKKRAAQKRRAEEEHRVTAEVFGELYAVHKRTLERSKDPQHTKNQRIVWNLPKDEVDWWMRKLKAKLIDKEKGIVEYYEKVRQDGKYAGVLDNEYDSTTIINENGEVQKDDSQLSEPDWKG